MGEAQTKNQNFGTGLWIGTKYSRDITDNLLLIYAKFGDIWAKGV